MSDDRKTSWRCAHCTKRLHEHKGDKCLFESTHYRAMTSKEYELWLRGGAAAISEILEHNSIKDFQEQEDRITLQNLRAIQETKK